MNKFEKQILLGIALLGGAGVLAAIANGRRRTRCVRVSPRAYRQNLKKQGVDLTAMDVDHIVPRSKGGPDHPLNYRLASASENRSLGARWDAEKCRLVGLDRCRAALRVTKRCGRS